MPMLFFTTQVIPISSLFGYLDGAGTLQYEISVYYVSKGNLGARQKVGDYTDLSFLSDKHFDNFCEKVKPLSLTEKELYKLKTQREKEIYISLRKLNHKK